MKKILLIISSIISLITIIMLLSSAEENIEIKYPEEEYVGIWKSSKGEASVSILDEEQYRIAYNSSKMNCNLNFDASIYNLTVDSEIYKVLRLDLNKKASSCGLALDNPFMTTKFFLKFKELEYDNAVLQSFTISDMEKIVENLSDSSTIKENAIKMLKMIKNKGIMARAFENRTLTYKKEL